jgi:hypothetical protein
LRKRATIAGVLAALSLGLSACGGGDDPASEAPTTQPPDPTLSAPETTPPEPQDPGDSD